jgi:hypothetical protein
MRYLLLPVLLGTVLSVARPLASPLPAQGVPAGRIEGEIRDSVHAKPLAGATVLVTRVAPAPAQYFSAETDDRGRYRLDTLAAGRYSVGFVHPFLDSIEVALPTRELVLAEGEHVRVDLATPSGSTLRALVCPGVPLPKGTGALLGQILDADSEQPLSDVALAVAWTDLRFDAKTVQASAVPRSTSVQTSSSGWFRVCGLPTDSWIDLQVQRTGRAGSVVRHMVPEESGLSVLRLSFSAEASRSMAALDSLSASDADTGAAPLLSGKAALTGTVLSVVGQPLGQAQVRVAGAAATATTDSLGRFTLFNLPAGTQQLETRHVGYLLGQQPVELRSGQSVFAEVRLSRVVTLDSMRVVARRRLYRDFEQRRTHGFGKYLDPEQMKRWDHAMETSDILRMMPGFRVSGAGFDAKVSATRSFGMSILGEPCSPNVVIDGMQRQDINLISPRQIGAMELYSGMGAPPEYDRGCGVIIIWTKR